ncbi:MAG: polyprenyl synthetase family protein [Desulfobacterales bacterium]|nr:polyprenyl synthetase family protein [Desulfobacterales bacterium]
MFNLKEYLNQKRKNIDAALNSIFENKLPKARRVINAMHYSLMAGGKRLRPILCIASAEALKRKDEDVMNAACALELIHTYSLIHDDLPAFDDDELRRGMPTCHIKFDEATAILAGDGLLTLAFEVISPKHLSNPQNALLWIEVINVIANAAGCIGMIEGQMRDSFYEGTKIDLNSLKELHFLKTGALIQASVCSGAILAEASLDEMNQLKIYAQNIGLAFQVQDDILNVEGDPKIMGKSVGTDNLRDKNTYPSIMGISESKLFAKELINEALKAIEIFDDSAEPLRRIASYIIERNV